MPGTPEPTEPRHQRRSFARALRGWTGRPLALAIGWVMSCALVTAVTLTAVNRVGHEVAGSTPRVITQAGVSAQASEQSASAASAASASAAAKPVASPPPTSVGPTAPYNPPAQTQPKPQRSQTPATPSVAQTSPAPQSTPPAPPSGSAPPISSPSGSGSPSTSPSAPPSSTGPVSPSPTRSVSKSVFVVPGGQIVIACADNSIANASATLSDSSYTLTVKSTADPAVDVVFTKGSTPSEYVYKCRAGQALGGIVEHP